MHIVDKSRKKCDPRSLAPPSQRHARPHSPPPDQRLHGHLGRRRRQGAACRSARTFAQRPAR
ncbi:MAG: hypothetical protein CMO32_23490, partial [Variovorax sp.]|nr:hypothetical protein [Variovorax sp.]